MKKVYVKGIINRVEKMEKIKKENLLNKIIKRIKEEEKNIYKANQIDRKHYKMKMNTNRLIQISENLKEKDIGEVTDKNVIVTHNGNPYVTYILAIKAICSNTNIEICVNETMLGTNCVIVTIIEEVLKELKIKTHIAIIRNLDIETLKNTQDTKIIVLQDKAQYSQLLRAKVPNVVYRPIYNVALYIDDEEFEDIKKDIIQYCDENFIEIEIYDAEDIEDAIEQLEADNEGEYALILTKQKVDWDKIKELKEKENVEININKNILTDLEERVIKIKIK